MVLEGQVRQLFGGLRAVVQYKARPERPDASPSDWTAMAAFDVESLADDYLKKLESSIWEYRVVAVPE
jgi:hypothetical protein